ncbi:nucleotidyltransferase domain-containing protein [Bifidobacterium imperatoris]|uniref:Nucleotidyltransferase n=1 Tax=Bifidobacterium imperatoris TaxID=2020965 RepID=A0A2N5IRU4_9BIFI|nr:nucleotidyltransferase domain-containing protein [Bifidobacterium imperatoris]PLS24666.1 nucleotidyltransferase [Bifidobacterium imperatoris]QSY57458.1 nucleotidyltransferase domain-containing protein [Bifidobacterium imperatoris]
MSLLTLDQVRNVARRTAANHGVGEMYVYGSVARGDNGPHSDVDFIYRLNAGNKATAGVVLSLKDDLESELGSPVSLLSMRTLLFNAEHTASGKRFYDSIKNDLTRIV